MNVLFKMENSRKSEVKIAPPSEYHAWEHCNAYDMQWNPEGVDIA